MPSASPELAAYAASLFALAEATGLVSRFEQEAPAVADLLTGNEDLRRFLANPAVRAEGKSFAVEEILKGPVHPVLVRFLQILQEQNRLHLWGEIAEEFVRRSAGVRQTATGEVVSRAPLTDEHLASIEAELGRILGKKISLRARIDERMLGGVIVRVGDFVLDGSLDAQLDVLRRRLMTAEEGEEG